LEAVGYYSDFFFPLQFLEAVSYYGIFRVFLQFLEAVGYYGKVWLPARSIVEATLAARKEVDPSGEILQLKQFCPWKEHLYELEEEHKVEPKIKYVLYEVRGFGLLFV
jgi:uncharacterized UPF0160 family protein